MPTLHIHIRRVSRQCDGRLQPSRMLKSHQRCTCSSDGDACDGGDVDVDDDDNDDDDCGVDGDAATTIVMMVGSLVYCAS